MSIKSLTLILVTFLLSGCEFADDDKVVSTVSSIFHEEALSITPEPIQAPSILNIFPEEETPPEITEAYIQGDTTAGEVSLVDGKIYFLPNPFFYGNVNIIYKYQIDSLTSSPPTSLTLTISLISVPVPPELDSIPDFSAIEQATMSYNIYSFYSDRNINDTPKFTISPAWLNISNSGIIEATPQNTNVGTHTVTVTVTDKANLSASSTFQLTIVNSNNTPTANPDISSTQEDTVKDNIDVLGNDTDPDVGDILTVISATADNGAVIINPDFTLKYSPNLNYNGTDTINYTIMDLSGLQSSSSLEMQVTPVNDTPTFSTIEQYSIQEDSILTIDLSTFLTDPDANDTISYEVASGEYGWIIVSENKIIFSPTNTEVGEFTLTIKATDFYQESDSTTISLIIVNTNDQPTANPDISSTQEDTVKDNIDVLGNDTDPDVGDILTVISATADNGAVIINPDFTLKYTPNLNYNGTDTINYTIMDLESATSISFLSIDVNPVNDQPTANPDTVFTLPDTVKDNIDVLGNDTDPDVGDILTVISATADNGAVIINPDSTLKYTPPTGYLGADVITYTITDSQQLSTTSIDVTIRANTPPTANPDYITTQEDTVKDNIDVLGNDTDPDVGDILTVISATADNGAVIINPDFTLKYTPNLNYNGTDTINYTIKDIIDVATSTVSVDVTPINDAPQLSEILDKFIDTGVPLIIDVATLASDVDGDTLSYSLTTTNPFTTIDSATGVLNISPLSTDSGNFVITISVTDGYLSHQKSFTLTVTQTYSISEAAQSFTRIDAGFNETTFPAPISPVSPFKLAMNSFVLPTTYDHDYNSTTTTYDLAWSSTNDSISFLTENVVSFSHPSANDLNEDIQLTATLSKLSETETQTLNITLNAKIKISTPQLVIRVKFTDTNFTDNNFTPLETGDYERVFGSSESNGVGSTKEFLLENSRGFSDIVPVIPDVDLEIANQLINNGTIVDSITDDGVIEYYTQTTSIEDGLLISPSNELLNRILVDVDKYIDFSRFDSNGDGHIASSELDIILNFAICNRASSASYCYPYLDPLNNDFSKPGFWPASRPGYVGGWGFTTYNNTKQIGNILESRITWITDYNHNYDPDEGDFVITNDSDFDILTHEIAHNLYNIPDLYNLNTNNWVAPWNQHNLSIMRWGLLSSTGFAEINGSFIGYPQTMTAYNKSILGFIDPIISTPYSRGLTGQTIDLKSLYLSPNPKPVFITNISTGELGDPWGVSYSPKLDNHQNMILGHQVIVAEYKSNSYDPDMGYDKAIVPTLVTVTADISSEAFSSDLLNADSKTPGVLISLANPTQISTGNTYATHAGQLKVNIIPKSEKIYESSGVMDDVLFKAGDQLTTCTKFHTQTSVSSDVNELHNTITGFKITNISESANDSFSITIENQDGTETCSKEMDY